MVAFTQRVALALALCLAGVVPAQADSWPPPRVETYVSSDGDSRVVITPRPLEGALSYFRDKVEGTEPAGQRAGSEQLRPMARLERRQGARWQHVWTQPLVNDVAPTRALVANGGRYLVTFDNWHSTGYGDNVVVVYDATGTLVRRMALADFLPAGYVALLPRSVSSLWWGGAHALADGDQTLVLRVVVPDKTREPNARPSTVPVRVRLADGTVLPHEGRAWTDALARVEAQDGERQRRWQGKRKLRSQPLLPPRGQDHDAWRAYMVELRERLNDTTGLRHGGLVLAPPGSRVAGFDSVDSMRMFLDESVDNRLRAAEAYLLVSPSSEAVADALVDYLQSKRAGTMAGVVIRFVGTPSDAVRVEAAAAKPGAGVVLIDSASPFPPGELPQAAPDWFQ
ncbi:hypothetical protein E2F46_15245 [Luteimonas aestuarii]|uniref:DUF2066 domain-containing protein n=1 Tax=Luteimonas aestuarii TaxID=453837 RepID=A0A4R5TQT4_9GAMM|nr:hypothetical protein [Luteimonas aestuarii]TDK21053.1 hypothetical protein E2F46_15245 [Luteimonas aestuarii]